MTKIPPTSLQIPLSLYSLFLLTLAFLGNSQTSPNNPEQSILLQLKQYWSNPSSLSHWTQSSNSNPNPNPNSTHCQWPEITCNDGSITGITLFDKNITGTIPPFICDLENLTLIDFQYNYIPGSFPTVLYNCSNLNYLDLSQNYFVGPIPDDIHRFLPRLRFLSIGANNFTGNIPASIGLLSELTSLQFYQNQFNGTFPPEIGNLSNLEVLYMSFNAFLPSSLPLGFTQLKKLRVLQIRLANLMGEIPESIGNLTALEHVDLGENDLTGKIPNSLFLFKNLTIIYLDINKLYGEIPNSVEALNLEEIDLSVNDLTGPIPEDFGKLTNLWGLNVYSNKLSSEIPISIGRLTALKDIRLFSNNFSGELPPDFGKYSMLNYFEVSSNKFTGRLPENLCLNRVLMGLSAFENNFTGELPGSLGNCGSLVAVQAYGNRLSGKIPDGLWTASNLTQLMMSENAFTGQLPDKVATNLSRIEIDNNQFSGEIPVGISTWRSLTVFKASNNMFGGTIPRELTSLPQLTILLLDKNQFSGNFPSEIVSWRPLSILNVGGNRLTGQIPAQLGFLPSLTDLDFSENELSGQIPPQIGHLRLTSLNLSSNNLNGRIPFQLENSAFSTSFLNNPGLCANSPSLGLKICSSRTRNSNKISSQLLAIMISIASGLFVLAIILVAFATRFYRKRKGGSDLTWKLTSFQRLNFTESNILSSLTDNNVIGSGGSGKVYRVPVSRSGEFVAVKRIWNNKKLDEKLEKEFQAEAEILGTIKHSNIVKLMCCLASEDSKLLVYEYLENRSLVWWLRQRRSQTGISRSVHHVVLDWPKRLNIAVGAARGLCYMHHHCSPPIVHRDVKLSNILLDSEFNAKIADFGLARILVKQGEPNTMSVVAGSFGYFAPEYARTMRVNEKIDVYSFGVVLLELATGKEANYGDEHTSLVEWAWRWIQEGNPIGDCLDEEIKEDSHLNEMTNVFKLGIICTSTLPSTRPTMKDILQVLLRYSDAKMGFREKIGEYDSTPLLKNSKREQMMGNEDGGFASNV